MDCLLCTQQTQSVGSVDFNRGCLISLPESGERVEYHRCGSCGTIFAPQMCSWPKSEYAAKVYNDKYRLVDPEISGTRARRNADWLCKTFGDAPAITHLDYGGSDGLLTQILRAWGWDSMSYDPMNAEPFPDHQFNLVTAFEVFEHAPDPQELMRDMERLVLDVMIFSTALNDGVEDPIGWWYLAPRNGHVVLYSKRSLDSLLRRYGFWMVSVDAVAHLGFRRIPPWFEPITA